MDINDENFLAAQKIVPVKIEEEMKKSYIDYAMSVIVSRAPEFATCNFKKILKKFQNIGIFLLTFFTFCVIILVGG